MSSKKVHAQPRPPQRTMAARRCHALPLVLLPGLLGLLLVGPTASATAEPISLYSSEDRVIDVYTANITAATALTRRNESDSDSDSDPDSDPDSDSDSDSDMADAAVKSPDAVVFNSDRMWVVEFYSHWCGHCQNFAPTWVDVAEKFKDWSSHVSVAAVNCAEELVCADFLIYGTPTVRVFPPGSRPGFTGNDIPMFSKQSLEYISAEMVKYLNLEQQAGTLKPGMPNLTSYTPTTYDELHDDVRRLPPGQHLVLVMEHPEEDFYLGADVLLGLYGPPSGAALGKTSPARNASQALAQTGGRRPAGLANLEVRRVDAEAATWSFPNYIPSLYWLPAVVHVQDKGSELAETVYFPDITTNKTALVEQMKYIVLNLSKSLESGDTASKRTTTTTTTLSTTTTTLSTTTKAQADQLGTAPEPASSNSDVDVVYASDLEKSIEYTLVHEIPSQPILGRTQLATIYMLLELLVKYLPLRSQITEFLVSLREWPVRMNHQSITGQEYLEKVTELIDHYRPFDGTPEEWRSCRGSEPHYRGYPCSLWVLFHALTVNAAIQGDPSMSVGGPSTVAKTMSSYIPMFFTCRHCAENFAHKVNQLGFLPRTPDNSVLWLWQIHNMANADLAGDLTEDPEHPKIFWPSEQSCPDCRGGPLGPTSLTFIDGQVWDVRATVEHLAKVYRKESIIPNTVAITDTLKEKKLARLRSLMAETMVRLEVLQTPEGRFYSDTFEGKPLPEGSTSEPRGILPLSLANLKTINQYCDSVFDQQDL